jgi:hypothetical protein
MGSNYALKLTEHDRNMDDEEDQVREIAFARDDRHCALEPTLSAR